MSLGNLLPPVDAEYGREVAFARGAPASIRRAHS